MKRDFEKYLIKQGYKVKTPSGKPSTVYDYIKRIDNVCEWEMFSWESLANNLSKVIIQYDVGGTKQHLGNKSHRSVINALKRFGEFLHANSGYK